VNHQVRCRPETSPFLCAESTYLIAGGFGGLGRAMAQWLVRRGARHLILLSRSGPRSTEAQNLMKELTEKDVRVYAPSCDISNRAAVRSVLDACEKEMPPIKGCIQSTMVMIVRKTRPPLNRNSMADIKPGANFPKNEISRLEDGT